MAENWGEIFYPTEFAAVQTAQANIDAAKAALDDAYAAYKAANDALIAAMQVGGVNGYPFPAAP